MTDEQPRLKVPPHSLEAEWSVFGGLFLEDRRGWPRVSSIVQADDFYNAGHRLLFDTMRELAEATEPLDVVTVSEALKSKGLAEKVGMTFDNGEQCYGNAYLAHILESTPSAANVEAYARIVKRDSAFRDAIRDFSIGAQAGYERDGETVEAVRDRIVRAGYVNPDAPPWTVALDIKPRRTEWLWHEWLPRGELTLFAAPGGSGKGTFWCYLAACVTGARAWPDGSVTEPAFVAICSPEDSAEKELVPRLALAGADLGRCLIMDSPDAVYRLPNIEHTDLVIVDPIRQGMAGKNDSESDVRPHITPWMHFAKDHNVAVLAVHHFGKYASAKTGAAARDLPVGSAAWVDVSRWVLLLCRDRGDEQGSRVLIRAKGNIGGIDFSQGAFLVFAKQGVAGHDDGAEITNASVSDVRFQSGDAEEIFFAAITPPQNREQDAASSDEAQMVLDAIRERGGASCARWIAEDTGIHRNTVQKWIGRWMKKRRIRQRKPTDAEVALGIPRNAKTIILDEPPEVAL